MGSWHSDTQATQHLELVTVRLCHRLRTACSLLALILKIEGKVWPRARPGAHVLGGISDGGTPKKAER